MRLLIVVVAIVCSESPETLASCTCRSACSDWCWVDGATCEGARRGWISYWQSCDAKTMRVETSFAATQSSQDDFRQQTYQQLRERLPGEASARLLLAALLVFKYVVSWSLHVQDAYWEDPLRKADSPWSGSGDATQVALATSYALIYITKRIFYVLSDVYFYVAVLTVFHVGTLHIIYEFWQDFVEITACFFLLVAFKASERFCPSQKFAANFWSLLEAKEGVNITMTMICLVLPPVLGIFAHWEVENVAGVDSASVMVLCGLLLFVAEFEYYLPHILWASRQVLSCCRTISDFLQGACLSLGSLGSRLQERQPLNVP